MRLLALVLILAGLTAGCAEAFGNATGTFDSLEDEAAAQMEYVTGLADTSVPDHEIVSVRVNVGPCEPTGGWKVGTTLVVSSPTMAPEDVLGAMVAELERRGTDVESKAVEGADYVVDSGMFGATMSMYWSTRPVPAVELIQQGACYSDSEVTSDDPHDIEIDDGFLLRFRNT